MSQELSTNTTLSHYRIVAKLGAGGMGEVWLAEDTRLKRKVALKLLPAELTADAERVRRFEQEAQAASALNHPNIITVYDIGESEAGRFIVMELVAGHTLRSVIAADNSLDTFLSLGQQIAKALSAAHAAGITHRDIKPDNIMVRDDGYVKVLDFGLARLRPATESDSEAATLAQQTTPGTVMGTVAYMSPEQARGEAVSHPSDVFALGIVLYELATGRHPFKAETLVGYLHAITLQEPPPLTQWKPELPAALNGLILRMLNKEASQRPTASEIAQILQDIERRGVTSSVPSAETETMMLPTAQISAPRADEGFWVAVLPFKWRGANAELEALAEGLSEDIVTGLSRFSYLRVIARSSTLRFTSETSDARAIGKEVGARYVMEGSLRQAGSQLRVAVQLVDAMTGAHLWAETYDRQFRAEDIFALQDELTPQIVSTVADQYGALVHSMTESLRGRSAASCSAHDAVLRAFGYLERISPEEHAEVRTILEAAVAATPGHSNCHAMLSLMYWHEYANGYNAKPDPLGRAYAAAQEAVAAAPTNQLAYYALANVLFYQKDYPAFRPVAERALSLNQMDASTTALIGTLIAYAGDWEYGLKVVERSRQLNPHHPGWYHLAPFYDAYRRQDYRSALDRILKVNMPGYHSTYALLAATYAQIGEAERAHAALQELQALVPNFGAYARSGFRRWFDAELTEHLLEGLRKAGLEISATKRTAASRPEAENVPSSSQTVNSPTQSIAVLPFANISADDENEYFCDGLAEELLNALAKIDELKVAARTSAFSFKGKNAEAREIGKTLNVNTVLEGSVRKAGNRIRINVQLVNAADGYHLWSERYDREMKDIFAVQDEITLAVVDALKVKLLSEKRAAVTKRYNENTEAYQLYLKGRYFWNKRTDDTLKKAIGYFQQAIDLDPNYALAWAGLADSWFYLGYAFGFAAPTEAMPKAKAAAMRALALEDTLAEAHFSLGAIRLFYEWDWRGAADAIQRALALNPTYPSSHHFYAIYLAAVWEQFDEAIAAAKRGLELDPLSLPLHNIVALLLLDARRYDEALLVWNKMLEIDPHAVGAYNEIGWAYELQGQYDAAASAYTQAMIAGGEKESLVSSFRERYAAEGITGIREAKVQFFLQKWETRQHWHGDAYAVAVNYARLGNSDQTFTWLETALQARSGLLVWLKIQPAFDSVRHDPRFADLLRRIGLPTEDQPQAYESAEANTMLLAPTINSKQAGTTGAASAPQRHTVGRERERSELRSVFNTAKAGRGALLCVAGEPGIGKTTLVEDFLAELAADNSCTIARGRCSERLAGTEAYLPLLEALESLLQNDPRLASTMKQIAPTWYAQVMPLTNDSDESTRLLAEVKAASQERMKRELAAFLTAVATPQPLVIFFDDLHWADVSTIDLLSFLAGKFDAMRVLIVVTYRPSDMLLAKHPFLQIKPDLQARGLCRELSLEFLTEAEIADYLTLEFPRHAFPPDFAKLIHAKTEGSPLFMADLVRYLRDRNVIAQSSGAWRLEQSLPDIERELPESVRGMIERKIAQLSEEDRKLLTAASVQGYEFDSAVVAQVLNLEAEEVEERLEKLERVFAFVKLTNEAEFPNRLLTLRYRFVHVLYQSALYTTLRVTRKANLSRAVAQTMESFYGEKKASLANELATLYEAGREFARAADYFRRAAEQASQILATPVVVTLAQRGLALLPSLPAGRERDELELALQVGLGNALLATKGWAAPEVEQTYLRARELCEQLGESSYLPPVLFGLFLFHHHHANYTEALALGKVFLNLNPSRNDPARLVAHRMMGIPLLFLGQLAEASAQFEQVALLYDPAQHRSLTWLYGGDSGISARSHQAWALWLLGYPDQALKLCQESLRLRQEISQALSQAIAMFYAAQVHRFRRESQPALALAEALIELATEQGLPVFLAMGKKVLGWAMIEQGNIAAGIEELRSSLEAFQATGVEAILSIYSCELVEAYANAGQLQTAHATLEAAQSLVEKNGERIWEAEVWRWRGELLWMDGATEAEVEPCFQQAIATAQRQSARSLELRAATSLARLWQRQGKIAEARQMLAEIYGWFTEGFDTADLRDAKALLEELQVSGGTIYEQ